VKINEILQTSSPAFSFEFFPPKTAEGAASLMQTAASLRSLEPAFVSVTYGAGGTTRTRTIELVKALKLDLSLEPMAHLTCASASFLELRSVLHELRTAGIENVLALRGDPPEGERHFTPQADGPAHASDLIAYIRAHYDFCIGAACYPEKHTEAIDLSSDLRFLQAKVQAGAQFLITQLFFDNERYFDFVARARRIGIDVPIIPGIMPITNVDQVERFTKLCGATIPARLRNELNARQSQPEAILDLGVAYATLQCVDLLSAGVPAIHFYTLNKSPATKAVVSALHAAKPWQRPAGRRYLESSDGVVFGPELAGF